MSVTSYGSMNTVWSQAGRLGQYIEDNFIKGRSAEANHFQNVALRIGSTALIIIGQIPISHIPIIKAGANRLIGWMQAISNGIGFSLFNIWANGKIVQNNSSTPVVVKVVAVAGGLVSQIPLFYMAYSYNNNSILCGILVLIANSASPIYSLMLMMNPNENEHLAKKYLINQITQNEQKWLDFVKTVGPQGAIPALFESIPEKEGSGRRMGLCIAKGVGALLSSANTIFTGTLGLKFAEQWTDSGVVCYIVGFGVALCTTQLFFSGMMGTATRAYNYSVDRLNGVATPSISSRLKPKLTMALWLLSLSLTVFSYNPSMIACRDNYTGRVRDGMMVLVPAGLYLLIANAITDLVDEIVLVGVGSWGSEEQKLIVQLHNQLQHFKREVVASSDSEFNEFKKILPSIEKFCELQV